MIPNPWREQLHPEESVIVQACLRAAADGPFFPDWECHSLFGLERDEVRAVAEDWPDSVDDEIQWTAVNAAFNNLLGYPYGRRQDHWDNYIPASESELADLYWRISEASGANDRIREYLAEQMAKFADLTDADLAERASLVRDVTSASRRYGVPVPERLVALGP